MAELEPKELIRRARIAWNRKQGWNSQREDLYKLTMPNRNLRDGSINPGADKMAGLYWSGGMKSVTRFANRMLQGFFPRGERIFELVPGPLIPDGPPRDAMALQLRQASDFALAVMGAGTFNTAAHEMLFDAVAGSGVTLTQQGEMRIGEPPVWYDAIPEAQCAFEAGPHGQVHGLYRRQSMEVGLIEKTWPGAKIPDRLREIENADAMTKVRILEATNFDRDIARIGLPDSRPWPYRVIAMETTEGRDGAEPMIVWEDNYHDNPWAVLFWRVMAGEIEGRGPGMDALPDMKTMNQLRRLQLENASIAVANPMMVMDDGTMETDITIGTGSLIPVTQNAGPSGPSIAPLPISTRGFDVAGILGENIGDEIKQLLMDDTLPPATGPVRSATEFAMRAKELDMQIGGTSGRIADWLTQVIQRTINILFRMGLLRVPIKIDDLIVRVRVLGPIARENEIREVMVFQQFVQAIISMYGPQFVPLFINVEKAIPWMAEKFGVEPKLRRSDIDVQRLQQQIAQIVAVQGDPAEEVGNEAQRPPAAVGDSEPLISAAA